MDAGRIWYTYFTDDVAVKARTDDMLQDLVLAIVHAAADYDMYATGKSCPDHEDFCGSYGYFRDLLDRLGIPPQAITDTIDECFPYDTRDNLTEKAALTASS